MREECEIFDVPKRQTARRNICVLNNYWVKTNDNAQIDNDTSKGKRD